MNLLLLRLNYTSFPCSYCFITLLLLYKTSMVAFLGPLFQLMGMDDMQLILKNKYSVTATAIHQCNWPLARNPP